MARILVVDDEASIRSLLRTFLVRLDHDVLEASDATEGLKVYETQEPDLVITDMVMPDRSGVDLLRAIKRHDTHTPVIILTGRPTVEAAVECLKCGATDFMLKPIDLGHLRNCVEDCLTQNFGGSTSFGDTIGEKCSDLLPGFHIRRILGVGNSSTVYLADMETPGGSIQVALKILKMDHVTEEHGSEALTLRFSREADVISRLQHPNIVRVYCYEVEPHSRLPYMALEYVEGYTLKQKLDELRHSDWQARARLLLQAADAICAIHAMGISHRDIKPHNMLIDNKMQLKLTDFGIVRLPDSDLTLPYQLFGTPLYMAPEAYEHPDVEPSADLFSLGVVAYELLTGIQPFDGATYSAIARSVKVHRPADPQVLEPSMPPALRDLMAWLLQKKPETRCPSAVAARDALADWLRDGTRPAVPALLHASTWTDPQPVDGAS